MVIVGKSVCVCVCDDEAMAVVLRSLCERGIRQPAVEQMECVLC